MKYKLFASGVLGCALMIFASPAMAMSFPSVGDRAEAVRAEVGKAHNYHAYLATQFASIAESEIYDHDLRAAKEFIKMAEEEAAKAGAAK